MTKIYVVRHGQTAWNLEEVFRGRADIPLDGTGKKEVHLAGEALKNETIHAVYSSPLSRSMETAENIAKFQNIKVTPLEAIVDISYGDWEGKKVSKLAKQSLWKRVQFFPSRMQFPNGEALREVQFRAVRAIEKISEQNIEGIIVVVSHADVIKLVVAHYLGVHVDLFQRIAVAPASVSVLSLPKNGMVHVLRLNDDGPLRPFTSKSEKKKTKKK